MNAVRFSTSWLEDAPNAAPEERATACDLTIWVNDQNVCLHVDGSDGKLYNHVTMPAYSLAEGLAHDWWTIFGARDREYRLIKSRMGYAVPDIRFRFDGSAFEATAHQHAYKNPDVRFWAGTTEVMTRAQAESVLAKFIEDIFSHLHEHSVDGSSAELRWTRVRASREDPDEAAFCEAAGALGVDPYKIEERDADFIDQADALFSGEPLVEFLAGASNKGSREKILSWIRQVESYPQYQFRLRELGPIVDQISRTTPPGAENRGWALGYKRARALRAALGIKTHDRISSVTALANALGSKSFRRGPFVSALRALISTRGEDVHIYLRDRPPTPEARVSELFAFTRAIGDAICFPKTPRSVVNELHEANRQAAGRAFAAEFLAPIDEVQSMQRDGKDNAIIADEMNVSTEVIDRQLENQYRIREACSV